MATFNGQNIFGRVVQMTTGINPVAKQQNTYNGLAGVEQLVLGQRGAVTSARGRIYASTMAGLVAVMDLWYSYYDGNSYVLFDTMGRTWGFVSLESVTFTPPVTRDNVLGYSQRYEATFFHQVF